VCEAWTVDARALRYELQRVWSVSRTLWPPTRSNPPSTRPAYRRG